MEDPQEEPQTNATDEQDNTVPKEEEYEQQQDPTQTEQTQPEYEQQQDPPQTEQTQPEYEQQQDPPQTEQIQPEYEQQEPDPSEQIQIPSNQPEPEQHQDYQPEYNQESSNEQPKDSNEIIDPKTIMTNTDYVPSSSMQTENYPMYVFGPMLNEGIKKFVSYQVGGSSMSSEITRRYSDFFALREKLLERWPGVYIPNIPPKKLVGNTDGKNIERRVRMLNLFCYKLSTLGYLFSSEEVNVFQTASGEIAKQISSLPKLTPEEIKNKYHQSFTDYYEGYDITLGLNRLSDFSNYLKLYQTNLNNFKESVIKYLDKKALETQRYLELIRNFEEHERCTLIEYIENKDENKLVFANPRNSELNEKVRNLSESLINPYNTLLDWIEEEEIDIEAMLEAMNSMKALESIKQKLKQKLDTLNNQLEGFRSSGKKTFTMIFKKPDEVANEMERDKVTTENNIQNYEDIIKMAAFNMEWYIERFKKEKSYEYFRHLKIFANTQKTNTAVLDSLWKNVKNNMAEHNESTE